MKKTLTLLLLLCGILTSSAQLLYRVEGNGLKKPSYLFGTHHMAPLAVIDSVGAQDCFDATEQVVGEMDMTQDQMQLAMAMQPHMMAPADSTLQKVLTPEQFAKASEVFRKWAPMPGMELQMLDMMKPMVVNSMMVVGLMSQMIPDFKPTEQLDTYFQTMAKERGMEIIPLETAEYQASVLYGTTPIVVQAESLMETVDDPEHTVEVTKELNASYMARNLDNLYKLSQTDNDHPEFMIALLDRRNADWLTKLPEIMAKAPTFVAVGALHLAGEKGLIEGLRRQGYTVTPIK